MTAPVSGAETEVDVLTQRQIYLLKACVNAELANNHQGDTSLSLAETEDSVGPDAALAALRAELGQLKFWLAGKAKSDQDIQPEKIANDKS